MSGNERFLPERAYALPDEAFVRTVHLIRAFGQRIEPTKGPALELPGVHHFAVESMDLPMTVAGRDLRHAIGVLEGLSLVGQVSLPEAFIDRVAAFRPFVRHSTFWGAYGPRAAGDLGGVVDVLRARPDSRQAVVSLYDSDRDLNRSEVVDVPCTVALQFKVRDDRLELWTVMRSNDAWLGLPYDLMQFAMVQEAVAAAVGVPAGRYHHSAGSMHLYDRHVPRSVDLALGRAEGAPIPRPWFGGDGSIGETASRARRILTRDHGALGDLTEFERWAVELLAVERAAPAPSTA